MDMDNSTKVLYKVSVNFSHSIIWLCVLCVTFAVFYFAMPPLIELFSGDFIFPFIAEMSAISFAIGIALPILLLVIKLKIQIREDGIYLKVVPFNISYSKISWQELENYEPYEYIQNEVNKLSIKYTILGKSYGLGGKRGLKLQLVNGGAVYIESRRPEKIIEMINVAKNKNS